jgi:CubicO group peptidase (beta-lactamase class C family)
MPEFKLKDPCASQEITISDLLSHRTGFETFQENFTWWKSNLTRTEIIQKMGLIDAPYCIRSKWGYCNAGYVVAGELIPRITGKSWEETVKEKILRPLKMDRTLMLSEEFKNAVNIAYPHTLVDNRLTEIAFDSIDNLGPAGSMSSCAKDMSVWLKVQLDNGVIDGEQAISVKAIEAIRKPYAIIGMDAKDNQQTHFALYGLGLIINDRNEKVIYSHAGGIDGFMSYIMFVPEEGLGIAVLTNSDQNMFFKSLTEEIRDDFLNLPYQDYSDKALYTFNKTKSKEKETIASLRKIVRSHHRLSIAPENFMGTYTNEVYGDIRITAEEKNLLIHFSHHPNLLAKLEYMKNNSFLCTYTDPTLGIVEIPFKIDKGKVAGLTLHVSEDVDPSSYEFIKKND